MTCFRNAKESLRLVNLLIILFIESCECVSDDGGKPTAQRFLMAAKEGDLKEVQNLLELGVDIETSDSEKHTGLLNSASNGHLKVVDELLKGGASVNATDKDGYTALTWAASKGTHYSKKKMPFKSFSFR